jgi:hypothetical protein
MSDRDIARKPVFYPDGRNKVKSEQGQIREVVLGQWFFVQVGMYESESPQSPSAQRVPFQFRNEYTSRVPNNYVGNTARPVYEDTYLPVYFR